MDTNQPQHTASPAYDTIPTIPEVECNVCGGDGTVLEARPDFDMRLEAWVPNEVEAPCPACKGEGVLR